MKNLVCCICLALVISHFNSNGQGNDLDKGQVDYVPSNYRDWETPYRDWETD